MKRSFSKSEKSAVSIVSDVDSSNDGDHITPFSKGGQTDVINAQLLSAQANRQKGDFNFEPRQWQVEFFDAWRRRSNGQPFMLVAIPGGGKTYASLEIIRRWMAAGSDRRCLIVVPSDNLREQWRDEATKFGLNLQTKEFGTSFKHDYQGGVVTYHLVASQPLVFKKLLSVSPTIAVFDELHHAGEDATFGKGLLEGCGGAKEKLLLSGTPWKTDGTKIPFVTYDGSGFVVPDYYYDYPKALQDEVVRYLTFQFDGGEICYDSDGRVEAVNQDINDDEAQKRLRKLLSANGEFVQTQIRSAHRKLIECRREIPDAAALAACVDQDHARKVAETIRRITGCNPSLIVSNNDLTNDCVKEFRKSNKEWLVTVRKISEGTDIKRLQVLCYFTNTTTELFFRQLVGRVSRVRGLDDFEAYVYLPADPRLIRCAQNIDNAQSMALKKSLDMDTVEREPPTAVDDFETYSTSHSGVDLAMIGNKEVTNQEYQFVQNLSEEIGVSMEKVVRILESGEKFSFAPQADAPKEVSKEERMDNLRSRCNKNAFRLSKLLDCDVRDIHRRFKPQRKMTEDELKNKLQSLTDMAKEAAK